MSSLNRWGATVADLLKLYPGTIADDFGEGDTAAGTANIEAALDRYAEMASECMSERIWQAIRYPTAELVVREATEGQTTWSLGLVPIVAGSVHQFRYTFWPRELPQTYRGGTLGDYEISPDDYTVTAATGAVTFTGGPLGEGELVFATYEVDTADPAFALESVKSKMLYGAAADLGASIYVQPADAAAGQGRWGLVQRYADIWRQWCEDVRAGRWVPQELRSLEWWQGPRPAGTLGSVRISRG